PSRPPWLPDSLFQRPGSAEIDNYRRIRPQRESSWASTEPPWQAAAGTEPPWQAAAGTEPAWHGAAVASSRGPSRLAVVAPPVKTRAGLRPGHGRREPARTAAQLLSLLVRRPSLLRMQGGQRTQDRRFAGSSV